MEIRRSYDRLIRVTDRQTDRQKDRQTDVQYGKHVKGFHVVGFGISIWIQEHFSIFWGWGVGWGWGRGGVGEIVGGICVCLQYFGKGLWDSDKNVMIDVPHQCLNPGLFHSWAAFARLFHARLDLFTPVRLEMTGCLCFTEAFFYWLCTCDIKCIVPEPEITHYVSIYQFTSHSFCSFESHWVSKFGFKNGYQDKYGAWYDYWNRNTRHQMVVLLRFGHRRHNERHGVWNHRYLDCLLNCLFRRR